MHNDGDDAKEPLSLAAKCVLVPAFLCYDGAAWLTCNCRGLLVCCLVFSNFTAFAPFWVVQAVDRWLAMSVIVMMALSAVSHALEGLSPRYHEHRAWQWWNQADRLWVIVVVLMFVRFMCVQGVGVGQFWSEAWELVVVACLLASLNYCSVQLRAVRDDGYYAFYVFFHSIWHLLIYRVLAVACERILAIHDRDDL